MRKQITREEAEALIEMGASVYTAPLRTCDCDICESGRETNTLLRWDEAATYEYPSAWSARLDEGVFYVTDEETNYA